MSGARPPRRAARLAIAAACVALTASAATPWRDVRDGSAGPAEGTLDPGNPRHVRAVYLDLLGRSPDGDEARLAAAARPDVLLRLLAGSREFWEHWYEDELHFFLLVDNARPAAPEGDDGLPARLSAGKQDVLGAVREIVSGSAFNRANPGNDTFVSVVFEQLLGLTVQNREALLEAGKRMYDGEPATLFGEPGAGQADVVAIVVRQPEFAERVVARQYRRLVGGDPEPGDARRWAARLREAPGGFPDLVAEWLASPAYGARLAALRPKTDVQFIRGLYVDLTGAPPDGTQLQRLRGALGAVADAGPLRAVIARSLLEQHADRLPRRGEVDGEAFIREAFQRYLGRGPGPEELADFLLVYQQEDCQPATIVRAIVTHWEYQYY